MDGGASVVRMVRIREGEEDPAADGAGVGGGNVGGPGDFPEPAAGEVYYLDAESTCGDAVTVTTPDLEPGTEWRLAVSLNGRRGQFVPCAGTFSAA